MKLQASDASEPESSTNGPPTAKSARPRWLADFCSLYQAGLWSTLATGFVSQALQIRQLRDQTSHFCLMSPLIFLKPSDPVLRQSFKCAFQSHLRRKLCARSFLLFLAQS